MKVIDRGSGIPVVMVPGLQGRWEWMTPAVDAMARYCRVITFSLCDEPSSGFDIDPRKGVENFLAQIEAAMDAAQVPAAVLMGVSYGGPLAAEFAVRHPERVRGLVLVSALPPDWAPDARARFYLRAPLLFSPIFFIDAPARAAREMRAAFPRLGERVRFSVSQTRRLAQCAMSPTRMARRLAWLGEFHFSDPSRLQSPVLVITGEPGLDRVVRPELTRKYLQLLPQARSVVLRRTGHMGVMTKPREFAELVRGFLHGLEIDADRIPA